MSPMDFQAARSRVRGLVASKKPQDLSRSGLTPDKLRDDVIEEEAEHIDRVQSALGQRPTIDYEIELEDGTKEQRSYDWTTWGGMLKDVARANFGFDEPELLDAARVKPSHRLNREILAETILSDPFMDSRPYTRGNPMESWYGSLAFSNDLRDSAKTRLAEHIARSQEMEQAEDEIEDADQMMDRLRERARGQLEKGKPVSDQVRRDIKGQVKRRQAARDRLADLIQAANSSSMVADAIAAANSAAGAAQEAIEMLNSLPGTQGGRSRNMSPDQQIALAERWGKNPRLRAIAKMLGRMYRDMRFRRETRAKNVPIEPVGVTIGADLERLLPLEAARAMSDQPLSRFTFVRDWSAGQLLQYDMEGKMPAGKGPCIAVVDGSGSMNGEKIIWANSLCLSVMTMMHREKRDFAAIQFGHGPSEIKVWHFPRAVEPDPDEVIDMASHLFGGGTTTVEGMANALAIIEAAPEFKTADIILIADGQDHFRERDTDIRTRLRAKDVRVHGISILAPNNAYMQQMCDYVEDVLDLADLAGANDTSTKIAQNLT